jgi:hypothetical protein
MHGRHHSEIPTDVQALETSTKVAYRWPVIGPFTKVPRSHISGRNGATNLKPRKTLFLKAVRGSAATASHKTELVAS